MNNSDKKTNSPFLTLLIGTAIMVAALWTGKAVLFTWIIIPFAGAYITARLTPSWSIVFYVAAAAACFLLLGELWLMAFVMITLSSLLTGIAVRRKLRSYEAIILSCAGWLLSFGAVIAATYIFYGTDPLTQIVEKYRVLMETSDFWASISYMFQQGMQIGYAPDMETSQAILFSAMELFSSGAVDTMREYVLSGSAMATINNLAALVIPSLAVQCSMLGGLFSYLTVRVSVKRRGQEVASVPHYRDFKMPLQMTTPLAVVYILSMLAMAFINLPAQVTMVLSILSDACALIFTIQAATLINWFLSLRVKKSGVVILLSILIPMAANMLGALPWLGFFEMLFKLRYRAVIKKTNNTTQL